MSHPAGTMERARAVRAFNRFYTRRIGLLNEDMLGGGYSLPQLRVLYEIAIGDVTTGAALADALRLDPGYVSRLIAGLRKQDLVVGERSPDDRRRTILSLTSEGRRVFEALRAASQRQIEDLLAPINGADQDRLVDAMSTIQDVLDETSDKEPYLLRPHRIGDIGHVIRRHGMLYAREHGWDGTFEAMVARIGAEFLENFDPEREVCWIAERHGDILGGAFVVRESDTVAKLRMVYVEPSARGLGIGKRLLTECLRFARDKRYARMVLWTDSGLAAARGMYEGAGFRLVREEPHHSFGKDLIGQYWERDL